MSPGNFIPHIKMWHLAGFILYLNNICDRTKRFYKVREATQNVHNGGGIIKVPHLVNVEEGKYIQVLKGTFFSPSGFMGFFNGPYIVQFLLLVMKGN